MAVSFNNVITKNYHGRVGDIVLRWFGGRSVMSKRPDCSKVIRSERQLANNDRFKKAVKYGQYAIRTPELLKHYRKIKKSNQSAYNAAVSDFLLNPKVEAIDIGGYIGVKGNKIGIRAWDKYKVESVSVVILNKMGQQIEKGAAVARPLSGSLEWDYTATVENVDYKSCKVLVRVSDLPGNVVQAEVDVGCT
jgi:hypothetical protein